MIGRCRRSRSSIPPKRELGDLGTPVAFELARRLRKAPRVIAQEIASAFGDARRRRARSRPRPNGYLNFFLERPRLPARPAGSRRTRDRRAAARREAVGKAIVEHTAINPNKAAHIGHLRNSALGDTLVRVLRFRGIPVEVQNYIDDTGVQVADVVVGFRVLEQKCRSTRSAPIADTTRFDYFCWDLYARVTEWYGGDKERLAFRASDAARHRTRRQRERRHRRLRRRPHRPLPPEDDGTHERRLRPPHLGGRHPPAQVLGAGVRRAQGARAPSTCRPKDGWPAAG